MRYKGKISSWKDEKGFGFITPYDSDSQVFVHIKSFKNKQRRPVGSEIVTYELTTDAMGRPQATNVTFAGERLNSPSPKKNDNFRMVLATGFLGFVAATVASGYLPLPVLVAYSVASAIAFVVYAFDKSAAKNDRRRTAENTLHLFALIGGWPGALIAQKVLRHKSKKESFLFIFWTTVILNCGVLGWLFTPSGSALLREILSRSWG